MQLPNIILLYLPLCFYKEINYNKTYKTLNVENKYKQQVHNLNFTKKIPINIKDIMKRIINYY